jgi:AraC-like DNA-binding protein
MSRRAPRPQLYSFPDLETPLGRVHFGGFLPASTGTGLKGFRRYGMYAAVLILRGEGIYRDASRREARLSAGQVIMVFPELPHHYGPRPGTRWDECFVAFSGAAFDAWRAYGLDPAHPVWALPDPAAEQARLRGILRTKVSQLAEATDHAAQVHRLLAAWLAQRPTESPTPPWLAQARQALATPQDARPLRAIARQSGLHEDAFRRAFRRATGETPAGFRRRHRLALAADLLRRPDLNLAQIAESLGFHDAFHFSKQFKAFHGVSPSIFRRQPPGPSGKIIRRVRG